MQRVHLDDRSRVQERVWRAIDDGGVYDNPATHRFYGLQAHESPTGQRASKLGM